MFYGKPTASELILIKVRELPLPVIEKLHRKYGFDFIINDGQLVGISGVGIDYGDMPAMYPAAL